ncbi:MAG TPA: metal-dependent phosphohydrolase [Actinopolymorphaceae bacterium]|jgi:predicted metal-dependent HD superfamily phosphohydrolase
MGDDLLARWEATLPGAPDLGRDLLRRYAEPQRRYHDVRHLADVLATVDLLARHADDMHAVQLAAWFHDAVYDPRRHDNEEASARLAEASLAAHGVPQQRIAEVARLVRLTTSHDPEPTDHNGIVLCDADLAILAADPARYGEYVAAVRTEYAHLEDAAFRRGRRAVVERLLERERLFHTPFGRTNWEQRARHNLATELALLAAQK